MTLVYLMDDSNGFVLYAYNNDFKVASMIMVKSESNNEHARIILS